LGESFFNLLVFPSLMIVSIQAAIEANDACIERLEAIRNAAGFTIDQDDD
jgi:hypothetical protein